MKLSISGDIELADTGYVTWLEVRAYGDHNEPIGTARVGIVHVGEIADAHGDLWPALKGTRLAPIHDLYFSQGWYNDEYADGAGIDLLFVDRVDVDDAARAKNLDLAIVRRLCDTLGSGCQLACMAYESANDATHWARLGFTSSTSGRGAGYMHMKLGYRHARVVSTATGEFEVQPTEPTIATRRAAN